MPDSPDPDRPEGLAAVFDPFSGISGDMILGCWIDLGLDREWLRGVAATLELDVEVEVDRVRRAGLSAAKVTVRPHQRGAHGHGRHAAEIRERIEGSDLEDRARSLALGAFRRLAEAEGRVHGVPPDRVHFHEVGAADAILDICAAADGFVRLGLESASTFPVALGGGSVQIVHGTYPVPAPATAFLLEGTAVRPTVYDYECVTPTGAALLAELCRGRAPAGDLTVESVGYGAGDHDPEDHPNCLRVWLVRPAAEAFHSSVLVLQTDLDDLEPEYLPSLVDACLEAGALDVVVHPVQMKKGRPAWRLEAQIEPHLRDAIETAIFRHSTTLGIRTWSVTRRTLDRSVERREWRGHEIRVKHRRTPRGGGIRSVKPEYEDVAAAARAEGLQPAEVRRLLRQAWPDVR